jgi:hypothetical protein
VNENSNSNHADRITGFQINVKLYFRFL